MSGVRRLLLDVCPGERRGVVLLDGRPERLLIEREGEPPFAVLGERHIGRALAVAGGRAFVTLAVGPAGFLAEASAGISEGAAIEVEVLAEARAGKGPRLRLHGGGQGPPRRLAAAPSLEARLQAFAPGVEVDRGEQAREAADLAQEAALAVRHTLKGGVTLAVEPTRALTAIDVDLGEGAASPKRVQEANLRAIRHSARLLRLKGLGGVIVIDLVGAPKAVRLMGAEAERAFAPDGPEVVVLASDRLGLLRVARPHGARPLAERLCDADGRPSARTVAQGLVRDLERELRAEPGVRLAARAAAEVVAALTPLAAVLGPQVEVVEEVGFARARTDIARL